jgi:hypothetical protein
MPIVVPDALSAITTDHNVAHRAYELYGSVKVTIPVTEGVKKPLCKA